MTAMKFLKKKIIRYTVVFSVIFSILLSSASPFLKAAQAAPWYNPGLIEYGRKVLDEDNPEEIFGERYTYAQVVWILWSFPTIIYGQIRDNIIDKIIYNQPVTNSDLAQMPFVNYSAAPIDFLFSNLPASGVQSVASTLQKLKVVPEVYAQQSPGFGFQALEVYRNLWKAVRNFAYLLLTIVVLIVAFGVMFRIKLSPQTVITIQSALPKIVLTIILITFSYAIVGFMIDLMYTSFYLIVYGLNTFGGLPESGKAATDLISNFNEKGLGYIFWFVAGQGFTGIFQALPLSGDIAIGAGALGTIGSILVGLLAFLGVDALAGAGAILLPAALPILLGVIIALITFIIRILIMLAKTFLTLLILLVFGPLLILSDLLPGNRNATINWVLSVATQIMIFLVVGLLFTFDNILTKTITDFNGTIWHPPYLGGGTAAVIKGVISLGVIAMIPETDRMVNEFMNRKFRPIAGPKEFAGIPQQLGRGGQTAFQRYEEVRDESGKVRPLPTVRLFGRGGGSSS